MTLNLILRYQSNCYFINPKDIAHTFIIIRFEKPVIERTIISRERIHARACTYNHVCIFPMDAVGPTTDGDSTMITWYRCLTMSQEEFRVGISIPPPRNHPLELAQGCVPDEWSAILLSYQWPDLTLHRATGNTIHGP